MIHVAALPHRTMARWARTRHAAYQVTSEPLPRKDFGLVPVCGAVRPSASQRELGHRA